VAMGQLIEARVPDPYRYQYATVPISWT